MANRALYSFSTSTLTPPFTVNDIALNSAAATNDNIFTTATPFTVTAAGFDSSVVGSGASSGADTGFLNDYQLDSALTLNSGSTATITIGGLDDTRTHRIRVSGSFVGSAEIRSVNVAIGATTLSYIAANADGSGNINDGVEIDATPSGGTITVTITVANGTVGYVSGIDVLELSPFYGFNNLLIVGASIMEQTYNTGTDIVNRFNTDYPDAGGWTVYGRAVAGWTTTDLRNNIDAILADYTAITNMAVLVHTGGNNISTTRPYSTTTLAEQQTITDDVTYICNAIITAGFIPILADVTFRNYANVDPLDSATYANGSEPYNINLYRPLTLSYSPYFADANGDSYMSFYYFMLNNYAQYIGSDGIHPTTVGRAALRQRIVDTIGYTAQYNVNPTQLSLNIVSSGGTAARNFHVNLGGEPYTAPEPINTIANTSGSLISLTDATGATAPYGVVTGNFNSNSPNTAGAANLGDTGFLYDTQLAQSFYISSGTTAGFQITGLDDTKLYNIRASGSRGGVSGRRTSLNITTGTATVTTLDYATDDGANGANYTDGAVFNDITPSGGIIEFNATVSAGSYGYVGGFDLYEQGEVAPVVIGGTATAQTDATVSTQLSNAIASTISATTNALLSTALSLSISGTAISQTDSTIATTTTTTAQIGATATATTDSALSALIAVPIGQTTTAQTDSTLNTALSTQLTATSTAITDSTISTTLTSQGNISALASATTNSTLTTALTTQISSTTTALTNSTISTVLSNTSSLSAALSAQTDSIVSTTLTTSSLAGTATAQTDSTLSTALSTQLTATSTAQTDSAISTVLLSSNSISTTSIAQTDSTIDTTTSTSFTATSTVQTDSTLNTALSTQITSTSTAQTDSTISTVLLSANSISSTSTAQTNSTIVTTTSTSFSAATSAQTDATIASILSYSIGATATAQTDSTLSTSFVIGSTFSTNLTAQTDSTLSTLAVYDISTSATAATDSTLTTTIIDPNSFDYIMEIDVPEHIHDIQIT